MDRSELELQLSLSVALLNFFEGDFRGSTDLASFYESNVSDIVLQYRLSPLIDRLFEADGADTSPWDDRFSYDLMEAYADYYDARTVGFNHSDTWEDICKHLILDVLRRTDRYQTRQIARDGYKDGRLEWLKRRALFSHIQNSLPEVVFQSTRSKNRLIYDLLTESANSDEDGKYLPVARCPDLSTLSNTLADHWESFSLGEQFLFAQVQPFSVHRRLRFAAFDYASLATQWDTLRKAFNKSRNPTQMVTSKNRRRPRRRIRGL